MNEFLIFPPRYVVIMAHIGHFYPFSGSQVVRRVIVNSLARIMAITTLIAFTTSIIRTRYTEIIPEFIGLREVMREMILQGWLVEKERRGGMDD